MAKAFHRRRNAHTPDCRDYDVRLRATFSFTTVRGEEDSEFDYFLPESPYLLSRRKPDIDLNTDKFFTGSGDCDCNLDPYPAKELRLNLVPRRP